MTALGKRGTGSSSAREDGQKPWMVKIQSPRVQCCLCTCCVMSALLGMCILSVGVCLVLNYNLLDVDTSGLPANLHNEEGKKVVGIILICIGMVSVIMSGVVSTLYFICSHRSPHTHVGPNGKVQATASHDSEKGGSTQGARPSSDRAAHGARPSSDRAAQGRPSSRESLGGQPAHLHHHHHYKHLHGNGSAAGRNSPNSRRSSGSLPYSRGGGGGVTGMAASGDPMNRSVVSLGKDGPSFNRSNTGSGIKVPRNHHHHRRGKKGRSLASRQYKSPLAPLSEVAAGAESQSLGESRRSASSSHSRRLHGEINNGADLEEDLEMTQGSVASGGSSESSSTVSRIVHVREDPTQASAETSPTRRRSRDGDQETEFTVADTPRTIDSGGTITSQRKLDDDYEGDNDDEDESGRMSRSTMDSLDLDEGMSEESEAAQKRLDSQIKDLINS